MNNTNLNFNLERNQRPTAMGSKNYLFSKNDSGAVDNAIFHTLLWSCDIVGVNPQEWLTHVLNNLHDDAPPDWRKRSIPTHSNGSIHSLLSPKIGLRSA